MKRILTALTLASALLLAAPKAHAFGEKPDPAGTIRVGAHFTFGQINAGGFGAAVGGNVFGEYVITDKLWIGHLAGGLTAGYSYHKNTIRYTEFSDFGDGWDDQDTFKESRIYFAPRVTYGINIIEKLEVHVGVMVGGGLFISKSEYDSHPNKSGMFCFAFINGVRYSFTDHLAAQFEFNPGFNAPLVNLGIVFKF